MDILDQLDPLRGLGIKRPRKRQSAEDLTPDQEQSLTRTLGRKILGGLSVAGNVLDVPGSMARDVLAGENPFDQLMSLTTDENRTSGRDLLRKVGAVGKNDPNKLEWSDFFGGLAEVGLDPLTYLTFGGAALTGRGLRAAKSGTLAKGFKPGIEAGQRGLVGVGLPFSDPLFVLGKGEKSKKIAGALDATGEALRYGNIPGTSYSPGRNLAQLFQGSSKGMKTTEFQKAAQDLHATETANRAAVGSKVGEWTTKLHRMGKQAGLDPRDIRQMRRVLEKIDASPAAMSSLVDDIHTHLGKILPEYKSRGMNAKSLGDTFAKFIPRYASKVVKGGKGRSPEVFSSFEPSQIARQTFLKDLPGGTDDIIGLAQDTQLNDLIDQGVSLDNLANYIKQVNPHIPATYQYTYKGGKKAGKTVNRDRYRAIARWISSDKTTREMREAGIFGNNPLADIKTRMVNAADRTAAVDTIFDVLAESSKRGGTRSVGEIMRKLKLRTGDDTGGWARQIANRLGIQGPLTKHHITALKSLRVSDDIADDAVRLFESFKSPESMGPIITAVDRVTNLFKASVTAPWPAFHTRNLLSGQFQNYVSGMWSRRDLADANAMIRGKAIKGAANIKVGNTTVADILNGRGIAVTDENATDVLREMLSAHGLSGRYAGEGSSRLASAPGATATSFDAMLHELPGMEGKFSLGHTAKEFVGATKETTANPFTGNIRGGLTGAAETSFGPVKAGEDIGAYIEHLNRATPFLNLLRKGVDPKEAAKKILAAQVDYSGRAYTAFERQILQRAFPFYKFSKGVTPYVLRQLWERPGGATAQAVRLESKLRGDDPGLVPDYVAESAAIPLGGLPDGSKRFITGFGAMHEEPFSFLGSGGARGAGLELLSRINPLAKAPLEAVTGQSFFQKGPEGGRPLEDLDPTIGRLLSNIGKMAGVRDSDEPVKLPGVVEHGLSNSPLARLFTTARTLTDERKGIGARAANTLSGIRVSDVSPAAQDAVLREQLAKEIKKHGGKTFAKTFIPKDKLEAMTPEERQSAELQLALAQLLVKRSKERRKQKEAEKSGKKVASR